MTDLSDVTAYLYNTALLAAYPNGIAQPSAVAPMDVRVFEGWPLPDQLDLDLGGKTMAGTPPVPTVRANGPLSNVSIFPMAGMNATPYQIQDKTYVIAQPVYGLAVTVVNTVITITGTPGVGEYVTIIADRANVYSRTGATAAAIIAALAADALALYPTVSSTATTLTLPVAFSLVVRQGGVGTLGKTTHRQKQSVMVTVWAPTHNARSTLAKAVDNLIKQKLTVTMADTSQILITYNRTNTSDDLQETTIYRRDLIYDVEYATVFQFPGYVVTSVNTSIAIPKIVGTGDVVVPAVT